MVLPNQLTIIRIILTPVFLYLFLSDDSTLRQISLVVFIIAALTDWYDGWLARKFNYITSWGKFWDPLADKILTSTAFIGLVAVGLLELWMVLLIVFRDFFITLLRAYADNKNYNFVTSYYAKWKTMLQMIFLYYLLILYVFISVPIVSSGREQLFSILLDEQFIYFTMLIITSVTVHSGVTYIYKNRHLISLIIGKANKLV